MRDKKVGSYINILVINIRNNIAGIRIYVANFQKWDYQYIVLMRTQFMT